jgi:integrase/recombinase XerD
MLDLYYKYPRVLQRLRSGALGGEMDRIAAHFSKIGYKRASAKIYISQLARFSDFAACNAGSKTIDQAVIDRFVRSLPTASPRIAARKAIGHARRVAPERFSITCQTVPDSHGPLLAGLDGSCGTYVEADPDKSEMNGITAFEVGEDPEVVYRREAAE